MIEGIPRLSDVRAAAERIAPYVHRTPVLTSATLDRQLGTAVFFKCENFQKVGAFKARGATNAVLLLDERDAARGVVTHSSGNHGAALAYAASIRRIPCVVVMPDSAAAVKVEAVRDYGAEVVFCAQPEREATAARVVADTGGTLIHPYDAGAVIAGQGTAALELLEDVPGLEVVVAPVGGGGLLSGTTLAATQQPGIRVIGGEPKRVDDAHRSLTSGVLQPAVEDPQTIADGLLTGLGERPFAILREHGVQVVTVSEEAIIAAARFHLQRMKIVVEPSGAVGLAALRQLAGEVVGLRVGVIISGGNTDFRWLR